MSPTWDAWSLNHWTPRGVPETCYSASLPPNPTRLSSLPIFFEMQHYCEYKLLDFAVTHSALRNGSGVFSFLPLTKWLRLCYFSTYLWFPQLTATAVLQGIFCCIFTLTHRSVGLRASPDLLGEGSCRACLARGSRFTTDVTPQRWGWVGVKKSASLSLWEKRGGRDWRAGMEKKMQIQKTPRSRTDGSLWLFREKTNKKSQIF